MQATRNATGDTRTQVAATTRVVAERTAEQRAVRDRLVWSRMSSRRPGASNERARRRAGGKDQALDHRPRSSRERGARRQDPLRAAAAVVPASTGAASARGFIWPVNGSVTSGFGWRWGRMHEGIDIAVPTGTPVVASASGTVIVAGWIGGYGNLVVIDHGGGIATAYGHNTSVAVGAGQRSRRAR